MKTPGSNNVLEKVEKKNDQRNKLHGQKSVRMYHKKMLLYQLYRSKLTDKKKKRITKKYCTERGRSSNGCYCARVSIAQ